LFRKIVCKKLSHASAEQAKLLQNKKIVFSSSLKIKFEVSLGMPMPVEKVANGLFSALLGVATSSLLHCSHSHTRIHSSQPSPGMHRKRSRLGKISNNTFTP